MSPKNWFSRFRSNRRPSHIERTARQRDSIRPRVEVLEDRLVPAVQVIALDPSNLPPYGGATLGPDGSVWAALSSPNQEGNPPPVNDLEQITPAGNVQAFPVDFGASPDNYHVLSSIVNGPNGNLWFTGSND